MRPHAFLGISSYIAALSHHDLNGFSSYPVYLSIRNLGNFSFMGEKSKLDILINNYSIKYPLQFEPSDGQDLTGFLSWSKVGKVTWLIECITPRLGASPAGESFARTVKELRPHCERASVNNEIFKLTSILLAHLLVFLIKNVYLLF